MLKNYRCLLAVAAATTAFSAPAAYNLTDENGVGYCPQVFPANQPEEQQATAGAPSSQDRNETRQQDMGRQQHGQDQRSTHLASHEQGEDWSAEQHAPPLESFAIQQEIPVPGFTGAPPALQRDVLRMLVHIDRAIDSVCTQRTIIDTECLEWSWQTKTATERWTLSRCGKMVRYKVTFEPAAQGGTVFSIHVPGDE